MDFKKLSNLQQRLIVSSLGIVLGFIAIWTSYSQSMLNLLFPLFVYATIGAALWEYYHIAKAKGCHPLTKIGLCGTLVYVWAIFMRSRWPDLGWMFPEIAIGLLLIAAFMYYFIKGTDPFVNLAITMFGFLYLCVTLSCLIEINFFMFPSQVYDGRWCLLYLLFVTKMTDTGAYFVGKQWGRRKLSPYISPKKTWEGAFGGLLSAIITSTILYAIFQLFFDHPPFPLSLGISLLLAILISITAQFGDLAESLLKRDVGVKDSSGLPGLGGFLDIVDSLVFTSPLMYIFLNVYTVIS